MPLDFNDMLEEHLATMSALRGLEAKVDEVVAQIRHCLEKGGTLYACGNGGSAADAQHFTSEFTGRFEQDRAGFSAVALTTDSSALTAIANDYGFERIFARQIESLGRAGDVLVLISTSGNSANLSAACAQARSQGMVTVGLLGRDGGELAGQVDLPLVVAGERTSRIQEAHIFLLHAICAAFEPA